jgi:hypothetical protein
MQITTIGLDIAKNVLWNGPLLSGQQPTSTRLPSAVASVENDPTRT